MEPHLCLFNTEAYHTMYLQPPQSYLRIDYHDDGHLVGSCAGVLGEGVFDCGYRAPFGGIDISGDYQSPAKVVALVRHVLNEARACRARKMRIHCRPPYAHPMESVIQFALLTQGFRVECAEISQGIELSRTRTIEQYVMELQSRTRTKLKRAMDLSIQPVFAISPADWEEGYHVIQGNRVLRDRPGLKYSLDYLHSLCALLPGKIRMLLLRHDNRAVAAALVYKVLPGMHYLAAWGDSGHDLKHSPMNLLAHELVADALNQGASVMDLGISSVDGEVNDGLVQFKRNVGASSALRLDLVRDL